MLDDLERPTVKSDDSGPAIMGGLVIGAVSGAMIWALIAVIISAIF
jgi:hypothetical protein